jgi:hypothetical protein
VGDAPFVAVDVAATGGSARRKRLTAPPGYWNDRQEPVRANNAIAERRRWIVLAAALGLTLAAVDQVGRSGAPQREAVEPIARSGQALSEMHSQEAKRGTLPEIEIHKLGLRAHAAAVGDPFTARVQEQAAEQGTRSQSRRAARAAPQPPPLPYAYLGKLIQGDETVVFLTRQDRNYIVRSGETLEGRYRVEAIEEERLVVNYLPLNMRQTLTFKSAAGPSSESTQASAHDPTELALSDEASDQISSSDRADGRDPVALLVAVPGQAPIGSEFSVRLGVPAGNDSTQARVVLAYNPKLVSPVDAAAANNGRLSLDLRGPGVVGAAAPPPTDIRFRVVATKPAATRLRIENPSATDIDGNALPLTARRIHSLAIVAAQPPP